MTACHTGFNVLRLNITSKVVIVIYHKRHPSSDRLARTWPGAVSRLWPSADGVRGRLAGGSCTLQRTGH